MAGPSFPFGSALGLKQNALRLALEESSIVICVDLSLQVRNGANRNGFFVDVFEIKATIRL